MQIKIPAPMNGALRFNTVAMPRASMAVRGRKTEGGLETRETGWCRLGGRGGGTDKRDTMKCCGVSACDCQLKRGEHTHNEVAVIQTTTYRK